MEAALTPGFLGALAELPVVESRAEASSNGLVFLGAIVVSETVVREAKGFREHPAIAVVLANERSDAQYRVSASIADHLLKVAKGDQGQDGVPKFRAPLLVDSPEATGGQLGSESIPAHGGRGIIAVREYVPQILLPKMD